MDQQITANKMRQSHLIIIQINLSTIMLTSIGLFLLIILFFNRSNGSHFRGGTITWRPLNTTPIGTTVDIHIRQRYSWRRSSYFCDDTTIANLGAIGDYSAVYCYTGDCSAYTTNIYTGLYCTDYSVAKDVSSGEVYYTYTFPINVSMSIGYVSGNWFANLAVGANGWWSIITRINTFLRPDGFINNSPLAVTLPVIYKPINIQHVHVVQVSDLDLDILKCRWSLRNPPNFNGYDECYDVCNGVPGATLIEENCTLVFTLATASMYYAVAIQIEDYYNSSYTVPMSSVPLQFLFYGYTEPSGCKTPPVIIGNRPNRACLGVLLPKNITEVIIAQVNCPTKSIYDFISSSPIGLRKGPITNIGSNLYQVVVEWSPQPSQAGPHGLCMAAVDNTDVPSEQWCITFLVGSDSPDLIQPTMVQGSASPIGTVFSNHSTFSIRSTGVVNRPTRNGTYIRFFDAATNSNVISYDAGWSPNLVYIGKTLVIQVSSPPWIPGHTYYVTLDNGVASGTEFCKPESSPIRDPGFWRFDIWNPALSSTTTMTTTTPTVGTVTTRPLSTTTPIANLTTTGIVLTSTTTVTTTTTTTSTSTSATTSTTDTTTTTTTSLSSIVVLYPRDLEKHCEQPVAIFTALSLVALIPIHILGMFVTYLKLWKMFDPNRLNQIYRLDERRGRMFGKEMDQLSNVSS